MIRAAVDAGITFFDGADIYGSAPGGARNSSGRPSARCATRW
ncbi:hypothetical protein [Tessaracoccus coleopterorum]|nr:hypothetical protein [Tessaracoccus coleopterorum]